MGLSDSFPNEPGDRTRRWLVAALVLAPAAAGAAPLACGPPRVLFVCPAGTVKSAIAREVLRQRALAAAVAVRPESRGVRPEDHVSPALAANLVRDGIDPSSQVARALGAADVASADIVIAFDEAAKATMLRGARVWTIPSFNGDYPAAKAALVSRVDDLVAELASSAVGCGEGR